MQHHEAKFKLLKTSTYIPLFFLVALGFSLLFFRVWPVRFFDHGITGAVLGGIAIILGTVLVFWSEKSRHHNFFDKEALLCEDFSQGIYKKSRHPGTFGFLVIFLGFAFILNSTAVVVTVILHTLILSVIFIPLIEQETERLCGQEYKKYKDSVRMWL